MPGLTQGPLRLPYASAGMKSPRGGLGQVRGGALALLLVLTACGGVAPPPPASGSDNPSGTIRLYTSVVQQTVDAVVKPFRAAHPEVTVDVFRAPTGQLDARIAAEQRQGSIQADVLWETDPLSMQQFASQHLFRQWTPTEQHAVPAAYRGTGFWGTRILNMVIIHRTDLAPAPADWNDLLNPAYRGAVAIPDPGFAGSAYGALAYFGMSKEFGIDYYRKLKANGAVQVSAIGDVITGVAEGRFKVGMALDVTTRTEINKGSPIKIVWPRSGAVAIYSPIGVFSTSQNNVAAEAFVDFVLSEPGQKAIAGTGWQPVRSGVTGGPAPGGKQVEPDWPAAFRRQSELLREYRAVFGA